MQLRTLAVHGIVDRIHDGTREVLLQQRDDNHRWEPPAGVVDSGENPIAACAREVWEETALRVEVRSLAAVFVDLNGIRIPAARVEPVNLIYRCRAVDPWAALRPQPGESIDVAWVPVARLAEWVTVEAMWARIHCGLSAWSHVPTVCHDGTRVLSGLLTEAPLAA